MDTRYWICVRIVWHEGFIQVIVLVTFVSIVKIFVLGPNNNFVLSFNVLRRHKSFLFTCRGHGAPWMDHNSCATVATPYMAYGQRLFVSQWSRLCIRVHVDQNPVLLRKTLITDKVGNTADCCFHSFRIWCCFDQDFLTFREEKIDWIEFLLSLLL